jgi:hypothetical protein
MSDLLQSSRLFEVSTRLQTASACLSRLAVGETPEPACEESLKWAGNFLGQVDWNSELEPGPRAGGNLAVQATTTRPTFYASVLKIAPDFVSAGVKTQDEIVVYLRSVYELLDSGGAKKSSLSADRISLAARLLHVMSQSLLAQLGNNGLPKQPFRLTIGAIS